MQGVRELARGELSARESIDLALARIEATNPRLNALTRVLVDAEPGPPGPLHGVPFTVKENIDLAGTPTTFGLLGDFPDAPRDAPHVAHLKAAGAVPVGRGNLPDLALRWHTACARYGTTINPRDPRLSPGGSSGGDAAAVASGMVPFAVGSDYGGSLRVPATACGICALRPTPGRFPMAPSAPPSMSRQLFATDGVLARNVEDLALVAPIMAQPSARDPRYTPMPWDGVPGTVDIAVAAGEDIEPGPAAALKRAADAATAAGHRVHEVELPRVRELAELWRDLLVFDSAPGALPRITLESTRRFLLDLMDLATELDGPGYAAKLAERHMLAAEWTEFLSRYPVVLGPVSFAEPWPADHANVHDEWWGFRLTVAVNALGLPAVSLSDGTQLIGGRWQEPLLLQLAAQLQ